MAIISVHECYTRVFELRAQKGEDISEDTIKELFNYEFKMYDTADKILTLTWENAEILINYASNLKNKIEVVPHGVDTRFYAPPKEGEIMRMCGDFIGIVTCLWHQLRWALVLEVSS